MRYLGIDYGTKGVGVALSDAGGSFAFPHATLANDDALVAAVAALAQKNSVAAIVVGDTRSLSGGENEITAASDSFAKALEAAAGVPIQRMREAWSSAEAMRFAPPGKRHDDAAAAAIILQRFLDTQHA